MAPVLAALLMLVLAFFPRPALAQNAVFEVPDLNAGLDAPPDRIDRRTPRSMMASFLTAADQKDWLTAAHLLDLNDLPRERQGLIGPILARQLHAVVDRKALLDWSLLIDRPDALQTTGRQSDATAGSPRRSLLLRDLPLDPAPAAIRLNRVQVENGGDPVWVFAQETVSNVPALYARYGPSSFELALPASLRNEAFASLMWWELAGLPLLLLAAVVVGWLVHKMLQYCWRRAESRLATGVLRAMSTPFIIASVTGLVWWVTSTVFAFSGRIDFVLTPAIAIGFVTAALLLIVNGVEAALDGFMAPGEDVDLTRAEQAEARAVATRLNAIKRVLLVVVFLVGVGIVLSSANLFESLGISLLASAGALTIVLGVAARSLLGNILASLQIAMNQSARMGDRIVYKGEMCHVERIHMTYVQLRSWTGTRLVVPVGEFVSETFSNWTLQEPEMVRLLKFKLDPRIDIAALRAAFDQVLDAMAETDLGADLGDLAEAEVNITGQDAFGIDVWCSVPCKDPNTSWEMACTAREKLVTRLVDLEKDSGRPVFPAHVSAMDA